MLPSHMPAANGPWLHGVGPQVGLQSPDAVHAPFRVGEADAASNEALSNGRRDGVSPSSLPNVIVIKPELYPEESVT